MFDEGSHERTGREWGFSRPCLYHLPSFYALLSGSSYLTLGIHDSPSKLLLEAGSATPASFILFLVHMRLIRWNKATAPSIVILRQALTREGFAISEWSDPAGTIYPVHVHEYPEANVVVRGNLRVGLPESGEEMVLGPGDRLDLPANTPHWADVNATRPVVYLSAAKNSCNSHQMR